MKIKTETHLLLKYEQNELERNKELKLHIEKLESEIQLYRNKLDLLNESPKESGDHDEMSIERAAESATSYFASNTRLNEETVEFRVEIDDVTDKEMENELDIIDSEGEGEDFIATTKTSAEDDSLDPSFHDKDVAPPYSSLTLREENENTDDTKVTAIHNDHNYSCGLSTMVEEQNENHNRDNLSLDKDDKLEVSTNGGWLQTLCVQCKECNDFVAPSMFHRHMELHEQPTSTTVTMMRPTTTTATTTTATTTDGTTTQQRNLSSPFIPIISIAEDKAKHEKSVLKRPKATTLSRAKESRRDDMQLVRCKQCHQEYAPNSGESSMHEKLLCKKPNYCDVCDISFTRWASLKEHKKVHHNYIDRNVFESNGKKYGCSNCFSLFPYLHDLFLHKKQFGKHCSQRLDNC